MGSVVVRAALSPTATLLLLLVASLLAISLMQHCCCALVLMSDKITKAAASCIFFVAEVREFIRDTKPITNMMKHDTGWAKGAPSEDYIHYPTALPVLCVCFLWVARGGSQTQHRSFKDRAVRRRQIQASRQTNRQADRQTGVIDIVCGQADGKEHAFPQRGRRARPVERL